MSSKIFRDCIKAIFEDEGAGTEAADGKFEQAITKLTNFKKSQLISRILEHSVSMLIFARKLKQIKQSDFSALNGATEFFWRYERYGAIRIFRASTLG